MLCAKRNVSESSNQVTFCIDLLELKTEFNPASFRNELAALSFKTKLSGVRPLFTTIGRTVATFRLFRRIDSGKKEMKLVNFFASPRT